ncbi:MAG: beta-propeller fold lactonase family protein [Bacteroidales bacterium]|nr:beta-propeller fold lactonase family protein [Bacteroidales bacterium]
MRQLFTAIKVFALCICTAQSVCGQSVVHPTVGAGFSTDSIEVRFIGRKQHFNSREERTLDRLIKSPKSVNIHPSGSKFYVNSLEGGTTLVYDFNTRERIAYIEHTFEAADSALWAPESGLFPWSWDPKQKNTFWGKPVESTFSHGGRYLWVPYYRRSFDLNAQDPSAVAVIDTRADTIVRMFETGVLPKMIATSPDGKLIAISHWGENTVGIMDISSDRIEDWHYIACHVVDKRLHLKLSRTSAVNRDANSGYCLRGTVFTPDNHYLLVGCMGGGGGIAVIDLEEEKYLGRVMGAKANLRHLVIQDGWLYLSINSSGYIQRARLDDFMAVATTLTREGTVKYDAWENCKVPAGARTLVLSPDGRYAFAACNYGNALAVVDTRTMKLVGTVPADSYPVGLDISADGRFLIMTSQGRDGNGGNAVDMFEVTYK